MRGDMLQSMQKIYRRCVCYVKSGLSSGLSAFPALCCIYYVAEHAICRHVLYRDADIIRNIILAAQHELLKNGIDMQSSRQKAQLSCLVVQCQVRSR